MARLGGRLISDLLAAPVSRSLQRLHPWLSRLRLLSKLSSADTLTLWAPRRTFSAIAQRRRDFFDYTSGRWIINDALHHAQRRRVFNIEGLRRLAAESVNRSPDDIVNLEKLAEGGFNRTFLITMRDGFQMVARIPYLTTLPKYFAVASEAATLDLLRYSGLPVPEVYGYSPVPENAAETEYIFMEFVKGTILGDAWFGLGEEDIVSFSRQLAEFESKMMSISFPAGGSVYYAKDLEVMGRPGIPLEDERFAVGPDVRLPLWSGRRAQLIVDRGPYEDAEAVLLQGAQKELAYLKQFGRPLQPFQRMRREAYQYQEQYPSDHVENLDRYLLIAPSIIPRNQTLSRFHIRHPDLQPNNIIISRSPDSSLRIVGLIDWQHASVLPLFLHAGIPQALQNYDDPVSDCMELPALPESRADISGAEQNNEQELRRRRLVHYHYVKSTETHNASHYAVLGLRDHVGVLRRRLFALASEPWEGETLALKVALMEAAENWDALSGGSAPCPIAFDADDVHETRKLNAKQERADKTLEACRDLLGFGSELWVPHEYFEEATARNRKLKESALAAAEGDERMQIAAHWPFDDMDEADYT